MIENEETNEVKRKSIIILKEYKHSFDGSEWFNEKYGSLEKEIHAFSIYCNDPLCKERFDINTGGTEVFKTLPEGFIKYILWMHCKSIVMFNGKELEKVYPKNNILYCKKYYPMI